MYEREKKRLASIAELAKNREKDAQRRHSAMLVADSLTNLASMYARSKGARYAMGTNLATPQSRRLYEARENSAAAHHNYNAIMAELAFNNIIDGSKPEKIEKTTLAAGKQQPALAGYAKSFAKRHAADVASANSALSHWGRVFRKKNKD